jgi:spermidine synthase
VLFLISGAGVLVAETTWMRWFRELFGATAPAASATLVALLAGQAAGAALAARLVPRVRRPLRAYGCLELGAALGTLLVPFLLALCEGATRGVYDALRATPSLLVLLRFSIALLATLPAALCFGATLPAVGAAVLKDIRRLGAVGSALYAANTLGAAVGTALAAFFLPDWIGVRATYAVAILLSAGAGACALSLSWGERELGAAPGPPAEAPGPASPPPQTEAAGWGSPRGQTALATLSGVGTFAGQVLLIEAFAQIFNGSVYAFGAVLCVVLLTLAAGAAVVALAERRPALDPRTLLGGALALCALGFLSFPARLSRATDGFAYFGTERPWPGYLVGALVTTFETAGVPLFAAGLIFPLTFALAARARREGFDQTSVGSRLGHLLAANTAGCVAGALLAPFVLLPTGGPWSSFILLAGLYALPAVALPDVTAKRRIARDVLFALGWLLVLAFASPVGLPVARLERGESLAFAETSAGGVVAVVDRSDGRILRTDNFSVLGGTREKVHEEREGHLALLLAPAASRVAYVGSATGISAGAALAHPISRLQLVEIVPAVAHAARLFFADANRGVYEDPRTEVVLDDAGNFLRATQAQFDLVIADLFVPWRAGTGSLYTREHFEAVRAHLAPDGVFCQWLALYQLSQEELETIVATFLDVFPRAALFRGDFYGGFPIAALVGFRGSLPSAKEVSAAAARLAAQGERDRWVTDPVGPFALYVGPLAPIAPSLARVPRNTGERPRIEFLAARSHAGGAGGKSEPVVGLAWSRFEDAVRNAPRRAGDDLFPDLPPEARQASEGGAMLQRAGAFWVAGRFDEAGRAFAEASALLPARLLSEAPADPTAAEVWGN